ncbi:uncharacterized protein [Periplaneta americana]|uniref:uncharacterized protein n=1 Tax=Periplaneta americana TaxID=6978 RepID=UPI0037E9976F
MRTSLLIFVLAAFVPFVFVEAQGYGDYVDPEAKELGTQLADLTQKVIDETKDSGVKAKLTEARSALLDKMEDWKWRINRGMRSANLAYDIAKKESQQFIDAASPENKAAIKKVLQEMDKKTKAVRKG